MPDPASNQILYPVFAMFALVMFVLSRMRSMRVAAVRSREVSMRFYEAFRDGAEPERLRVVTRHFVNLFEMPVLFYVGVLMTYVTHNVSGWMVGCAWAYVALRYAHSYVHLTSNAVPVRVTVYFASAGVLLVMWATLLVRLVRAGSP
jgi:hypothetical protein